MNCSYGNKQSILPKQYKEGKGKWISDFVQELKVKVNTTTVMTMSHTCKQVFVLKAKTEETSYAKMNATEQKQIGQQTTHEKTD